VKNNILFYVCPRCSLVIMVGEIHPEQEEQSQEVQEQEQAQEEPQERPVEQVTEKHKKRRAKVEKTQNE